MDSPKRKISGYTALVIIVVLLSACVFLCLSIFSNVSSLIENNKIEIQLDDSINEQNIILDSLNEDLEYYKSLEEDLIEIKEIFFSNALKADLLARNKQADFKVCYLTFDDGPYLLTDTFLDILDEKDVLATFFVRKRTDDDYKPIYLREKISGHTIGNHTASHKISKGIYRSEDVFIEDILENQEFISDMLGITTDVMRFPGGSYQASYMGLNKNSLVKKLDEIGYGYVDWNQATGDGGATLSAYKFLHNVIDYTADDDVIVVLMHDYSANTAKCLPEMIDELARQGYIFLPLWHDSPAVKKGS